jgi:serine phosphatase RsbU (regulator of sigma subunit)
MHARPRRLVDNARSFLEAYTRGLTREDLQRLFTRDAREAYRFFARGIDDKDLAGLSRFKRWLARARLFFWAFTLRLSPARRVLYGVALLFCLAGFVAWFGVAGRIADPGPGAGYVFLGVALLNLLVLLEVADRLSLKNDLEIAREIQGAMLPQAAFTSPAFEAFGVTRPANTVGGDFFDVLPRPDGRVFISLGDVAGKGSPAALLMALLLAMFRTLVDEGLESAALAERLNVQVARHSPASRFITLFFAACDPATGRAVFVNAGHMPGLLLRRDGSFERLTTGGIALGMFEQSTYQSREVVIEPGDALVLYSDGVTEAEDHKGQPFDEAGLERVVAANAGAATPDLARAIIRAVENHSQETFLADDITVLVARRRAATP